MTCSHVNKYERYSTLFLVDSCEHHSQGPTWFLQGFTSHGLSFLDVEAVLSQSRGSGVSLLGLCSILTLLIGLKQQAVVVKDLGKVKSPLER